MEITKREILFSVIIVIVMLLLGMFISDKIEDSLRQEEEKYYKALRVEENDMFDYARKTNVGNVLTFGSCEGISPVSLPELTNSYTLITKSTERYTEHIETETDEDGNTTTTVTYSWDSYGSNSREYVDKVHFMGSDFPISMFHFGSGLRLSLNGNTVESKYKSKVSSNYLYKGSTVFHSVGDLRYYYSYIPVEFNGTMFLKTNGESSLGNSEAFYYGKNISEVLQGKSDGVGKNLLVFRIIWFIVIVASLAGFFYIDNRWLEDSRGRYNRSRYNKKSHMGFNSFRNRF